MVTGAGNGIGRATALAFAGKGAQLALADIDVEAIEKVRSEIEERGGLAITIRCDVAIEEEVAASLRRTIDEMGDLHVLVSNAGVSVSGPPEAVPIDDWRWIVDINMWAHVYGVRAALPYFKQQGRGHLVHVASAAGILGTPGLSAYCMTKFAVYGLAESLAVSLHGTDIEVSVVCPLWVDTDIVGRGRVTVDPSLGIDAEATKQLGREMLRSAGIPPEHVAEAIVSGVEERRFLILPHSEVLEFARVKWEDPESYIERAASALLAQRQFFGET